MEDDGQSHGVMLYNSNAFGISLVIILVQNAIITDNKLLKIFRLRIHTKSRSSLSCHWWCLRFLYIFWPGPGKRHSTIYSSIF